MIIVCAPCSPIAVSARQRRPYVGETCEICGDQGRIPAPPRKEKRFMIRAILSMLWRWLAPPPCPACTAEKRCAECQADYEMWGW